MKSTIFFSILVLNANGCNGEIENAHVSCTICIHVHYNSISLICCSKYCC